MTFEVSLPAAPPRRCPIMAAGDEVITVLDDDPCGDPGRRTPRTYQAMHTDESRGAQRGFHPAGTLALNGTAGDNGTAS